MSEEQKHKDLKEKLQGVPLLDMEHSWQKMKQLLERKDDDDHIVPPLFLKTCAGWAFLFLIVLSGALLVFWPASSKHKMAKSYVSEHTKPITVSTKQKPVLKQNRLVKDSGTQSTATGKAESFTKHHPAATMVTTGEKHPKTQVTKIHYTERKQKNKGWSRKKTPTKNAIVYETKIKKESRLTDARGAITQTAVNNNKQDGATQPFNNALTKDPKTLLGKDTLQYAADSVLKKRSREDDSLIVQQKGRRKQAEQKPFLVTGGLALFQQIPLAGQNLTPYNYYGRTGSLADYIPVVYLHLYRENKWFIHTSFRYGAPQATKELVYDQVTTSDSSQAITTTTSMHLKKTFYHQVPLSFNYFVFRNWSLGAGGMFSKFYGAVSEREIKNRNNQSGEETIAKAIVKTPANQDSTFTSAQWHLLLQTEYQWKRWGAGLRYTKGVQPFIRYMQNGVLKEEKNHSLQVYIRYQILQSHKQNR